MNLLTPRMTLVLDSLEETRARIAAMSEEDSKDLSPVWLALLEKATTADPWILGFTMIRNEDDQDLGQCGYKGPPNETGMVEIAYFVKPEMENRGYATESAQALVNYAFENPEVQLVWGHTLPENNASTRVLTKAGFQCMGEVIDPEDGPVWRWELRRDDWQKSTVER